MVDGPNLGGNRIDTVPVHNAKYAEPELGPVRSVDGATKLVQQPTRLDHAMIILIDTDQTKRHVVHAGTKNRAVGFNVQTPAAVFRMLTGKEIPLDFSRVFPGNWGVSDIVGNDETW